MLARSGALLALQLLVVSKLNFLDFLAALNTGYESVRAYEFVLWHAPKGTLAPTPKWTNRQSLTAQVMFMM
jgi:hypothetical protein